MASIDPQYPVFVLVFVIFHKDSYIDAAVPAIQRLKFRWWGHDNVVLHTSDIKRNRGPFAFLFDSAKREVFLSDLDKTVDSLDFTLIAAVIDKNKHKQRYSTPHNPYEIALKFCMERLSMHLKDLSAVDKKTFLIVEHRGQKEDKDLELAFRRICDGENAMNQQMCNFDITFMNKKCNSTGLQIADLCATPIGTRHLNPSSQSRSYQTVSSKFRKSPAGVPDGYGMKVFP
ncbi:MAG: DUF3800 domain-containing protein [Armatimonadetes bacterium]|nr:DUF3800 domain-containing protein [Armatimonadota bacterium]